MIRTAFNKLVLLAMSLELLAGCNTSDQRIVKSKNAHPNIVLIMADDMGWGDVGCYNPNSLIATPNMDRLASQGIRLTDAHSPAALSSPSRYGLLTGRYSWRTRLQQWVLLGYDETPLIEKGRPTIASILKESGYGTAGFGKWHLGMNWPTKNGYTIQDDLNKWPDNPILDENERNIDFTKPVTGGPIELGFDYFFGTLGCSTSDPPYAFIENDRVVGDPSERPPSQYIGTAGFVPGAWVKGFPLEDVDVEFTNKAIDYMKEQIASKPGDPFFVYLALSSPHNPFLPPDFTAGKSKEGPRGDLVLVVDWSVGKIMEFLREQGIEENTLLIVTSDNGAVKGANGHLSEGPFRGYKGNTWEGGHRVPFIARWPGIIQPGTVSHEVISLTDMFASFSSLVSRTVSANEGEDSFNVLPVILGRQSPENKDAARIFHSGGGVFAVRKGDWKLIQGTTGSGSGTFPSNQQEGSSGQLAPDFLRKTGQLYDLSRDTSERINLWEERPSLRDSLLEIIERAKRLPRSNEDLLGVPPEYKGN